MVYHLLLVKHLQEIGLQLLQPNLILVMIIHLPIIQLLHLPPLQHATVTWGLLVMPLLEVLEVVIIVKLVVHPHVVLRHQHDLNPHLTTMLLQKMIQDFIVESLGMETQDQQDALPLLNRKSSHPSKNRTPTRSHKTRLPSDLSCPSNY